MKKTIIYLFVAVVISSCSKKLDIAPPNAITDEQIQELLRSGDDEVIEKIMGGMANNMPRMVNFSGIEGVGTADGRYRSVQGLDVMRNLQGNDIVFADRSLTGFGSDEYRLLDFTSSASDKNSPYWFYCWSAINTANKMLNYLDDETVGSNAKLQEYKARGLVLRAYAYNYLMENYQEAYLQGGKGKLGMPLYDFYSPVQESKARASVEETYAFIKKDLADAISLLAESGVGYTAVESDFDLGVAQFLSARIALWTGDWDSVITLSEQLLNQYPTLMDEAVYGGENTGTVADPVLRPEQNGFLNIDVNPEVIFGFPVGEALNTHNSWMNCFAEGYGGLSQGFQRIDERLYEQIADDDYRKNAFMAQAWGDYTYPTNGDQRSIPVLTNLKFAATHGLGSDDKKQVGNVTCYYMRSSEVLLMKAEAHAQKGEAEAAEQTLNTLLAARTKAGSTPLTCDTYPSMAGLSALEKVQLQTRIELWGEGGREYYNNKRWNLQVDRASSKTHVDKSTYPVSKMTLQIPLDEIMYNDKMVQN